MEYIVRLAFVTCVLAAMLLLLASCETITNRVAPGSIESVRVLHDEAGGLLQTISGRVESCAVVQSKGSTVEVKKLTFSQGKCEVELQTGGKWITGDSIP